MAYRNDPRWIVAKFPGKDRNGLAFKAGDEVFYYPLTKTLLAGEAGKQASRDFESACFDEAM